MTRTTARIKQKGEPFEIFVEMEDALKFKKGQIASIESEDGRVYKDIKKGDVASVKDLENAFGTSDPWEIAKKIKNNDLCEKDRENIEDILWTLANTSFCPLGRFASVAWSDAVRMFNKEIFNDQ